MRLLTLGLLLVVGLGAGCSPKYPNCDNDEGCRAKGEYCVNGLCQQCRTNENCGACRTCNAGACQIVPGCCTHDGDCGMGQACRGGQCGPECAADTDCGAGSKCSSGRCVPDVECTGDGDCPGGEACQNGRCVAVQGSAGGTCEVDRIHFDFDSAEITSEAARILQSNAKCLQGQGNPKVTVGGHCDDRGTEEYNLHLGDRRARAAKKYLEKLGVSGLKAVSYGENRPIHASASGESEHQENRRAEFDR